MQSPAASPAALHAACVAAACRQIETASTPPSLAELAAQAGLSPHHFHRVFKAITGVTPKAYASAQRAAALRTVLSATQTRITDAMLDAG